MPVPLPRVFPPPVAALLLLAFGCARGDEREAARGTDAEPAAGRPPARNLYYERVAGDIEQLAKMVKARPSDAKLRVQLGRKLLEGGVTSEARRQFRRALDLDPDRAEARVELARLLFERGALDEALRLVDEGIERRGSAALWLEKARILEARDPDDRSPAEDALRRALDLDPRSAEACYELGRLLLEGGDAAGAVTLLERSVDLRPNHLGAWFNLARARRAIGDAEGAQEAARRHRRLSRLDDLGFLDRADSMEASIALGEMLVDGGDVEEGLAELRSAVERFPRSFLPRVRLAFAYARLGRLDEGRTVLEEGLPLLRTDPRMLERFAAFLVRYGRDRADRRRAVRLAENAAAATRRRDPAILDTLAEARAAAGDLRGAWAAAQEALRLTPDDEARKRAVEGWRRRAEGQGDG